MVVENLGFHAKNRGRLPGLLGAPPREDRAADFVVSDITIGHGNELHLEPGADPPGRRAPRVILAVVRMCAKDNDSQRLDRFSSRAENARRGDRQQERQCVHAQPAKPGNRPEGVSNR